MSQPHIGEIRMFAGNFAPSDWALCDGRLLPISEFDALFSLIGTTYGGDGEETFALPDLRGRVPVHLSQGQRTPNPVLGQKGGAETVTLTPANLSTHNHTLMATTAAASATSSVGGSLTGTSANTTKLYGSTAGGGAMATQALLPAGSNQPHNNMAPSLGINYIISLFGVYPSPA
jgi:microcystin-dependent protein